MPAGHPHAVYGEENFKMLLVGVFLIQEDGWPKSVCSSCYDQGIERH